MSTAPLSLPEKTAPVLDAQRVAMAIAAREASVRGLTPERLSRALDSFDMGYLRDAALLWQKIRDRDDAVKGVVEKRELDAALLEYEILTSENSPEATAHKEALEEFYSGIRCTHALDRNQKGGVKLLIRQMLHSLGHKYAVHEIVWTPRPDGLDAELIFVPLQFFENTTGSLRFLPREGDYRGVDLEENGWMVTVGPGLMEATSIAYMFKNIPLKAWMFWCQKFGVPGLHAETTASPGSAEWEDMRAALAAFAQDWAILTSAGAKINTIEAAASGTSPHESLVDRQDRAITRLWRGADLGTMSQAGASVGSQPQESETAILAAADAMLISDTLQQYLDRAVIRARFGVEPLAYFSLRPQGVVDLNMELKVDDYLVKWGCKRGKKALLEKYGRPDMNATDEPAQIPAAGPAQGLSLPLANEQSLADVSPLLKAAAEDLAPARARIEAIIRLAEAGRDDAALSALDQLRTDFPAMLQDKSSALATALEKALGKAAAAGVQAAVNRLGPL